MVVLIVSNLNAQNLVPSKYSLANTGYYASIEYAGTKRKTKVIFSETQSVSWKDVIEIDVGDGEESGLPQTLLFVVKFSPLFFFNKNRVLGWCDVKVKDALSFTPLSEEKIVVLPLKDSSDQPTNAVLSVKFEVMGRLKLSSPGQVDQGLLVYGRDRWNQLVDPYLVVSFEGVKAKTDVAEQDASPEWNERIYLPFSLPLRKNSLLIEIKDRDVANTDDVIATASISLVDITADQLEGLLPSFGPAYVNFYGSQRKYKLFENDRIRELNSANSEGCAFRGRVFLQISTKLDANPPNNAGNIVPKDSMERSSVLGRKTKFILRATFIDCILLLDALVSTIEVSIGLFGDSQVLEASYQRPSCIPPFKPAVYKTAQVELSDQYFAPWTSHKPCVVFEVELQSAVHRLEASNALLYSSKLMEAIIEELSGEISRAQGDSVNRLSRCYQQVSECFEEWLRDIDLLTHLDKHLMEARLKEFQAACSEAIKALETFASNADTGRDQAMASLRSARDRMLRLQKLDPQNEFPDIFFWLYHGWEKAAFCRIAVADVWHSSSEVKKGHLCNEVATLFLKFPSDDVLYRGQILGIVRVNLWFGPESSLSSCLESMETANATYNLMAETYLSESIILKKCVPINTGHRWTNVLGQKSYKKGNFPEIDDWKFSGEWSLDTSQTFSFSEEHIVCVTESTNIPETNLAVADVNSPTRNNADNAVEQNSLTTNVGDKDLAVEQQTRNLSLPIERWWRQLVPQAQMTLPISPAVIKYKHKKSSFQFGNPTFYLFFNVSEQYDLRIYLYQARSLSAGDESGLSDPFVRATFLSYVIDSAIIHESLCPIWDQTLILPKIPVPGTQRWISENVPDVIMDVFDHDEKGQKDFLGRVMFQPSMGPNPKGAPSILDWRTIMSGDDAVGELLVGAELLHLSSQNPFEESVISVKSDVQTTTFSLPPEIKPFLANAGLEILCIELQPGPPESPKLISPFLEFFYNDTSPLATTNDIADFPTKITFDINFFFVEMLLPEDDKYLPSLTVILKNRGAFGHVSVAGACVVSNLHGYVLSPVKVDEGPVPTVEINDDTLLEIATTDGETTTGESVQHDQEFAWPQMSAHTKRKEFSAKIRNFGKTLGNKNWMPKFSRKQDKENIPLLDANDNLSVISNATSKQIVSPKKYDGHSKSIDMVLSPTENDGNDSVPRVPPPPKGRGKRLNYELHKFGKAVKDTKLFKKFSRRTSPRKMPLLDADDDLGLDFWSRYYASKGEVSKSGEFFRSRYSTFKVYGEELEKFGLFRQYLSSIALLPIYSGKSVPENPSARLVAATFVAIFRISRFQGGIRNGADVLSPDLSLQAIAEKFSKAGFDFLLRIYLIRALNLTSKDIGGASDPYVKLRIGQQEFEVIDSLRTNTLNPTFGCMHEMTVNLQNDDRHLFIKVLDRDLLNGDDMIGETYVDLRSRIMTPCRTACGLSSQYLISGPYAWRDQQTPSQILDEMCHLHGLPKPEQLVDKDSLPVAKPEQLIDKDSLRVAKPEQLVDKGSLRVGSAAFNLQDFENEDDLPLNHLGPPEERLALHVLHHYNFVTKEHIESRTLFNSELPGVPQGELEMWIDLFPVNKDANSKVPSAVDVSPRKPTGVVLRCIVYNAYEVILDDRNLLGDKMSDVYVRGSMKGMESSWQKTDVHHRCLNGEANFNWRLVFPFQYIHGDNALLTFARKHLFDLNLTEEQQPPILTLKICDYDLLSADDCLGLLELNLLSLVPPDAKLKRCTLESYDEKMKQSSIRVNLFKRKWAKGFWLCPSINNSTERVGGKLELELELLTAEEAQQKPAGQGRSEPNSNPKLDPPNRPSTSFNWLLSPLKFLRYFCFQRFRWALLMTLLIILLILGGLFFGRVIVDAVIQKLVFNL